MEVNFTLDKIGEAAKKFLALATKNKVVALHGDMGAGKTTFVHAVCEVLGVNDTIGSPTFSIIKDRKSVV